MLADYLPVETMRRYHHFYADGLKIKCPTGSRIMSTLNEVAGGGEISRRDQRLGNAFDVFGSKALKLE
jgi:hypothetical protein